ncbi:MAG: HAD family hydrolase [Acidimicrobiales bacterium]
MGPGGDLFSGGTTRLTEALLAARNAGLAVVPVTGRGRIQVFELCRLLGLPRGIAELGCIHVEGRQVRYELGGFPFTGETPLEAMHGRGAIQAMLDLGLEPHEPWNEGREATYLLRGTTDVAAANAHLRDKGFSWCELTDNGVLSREGSPHAFHLAPVGTGKAAGLRLDLEHHGLALEEVGYVGDSASDLACAAEVGRFWLVANADPQLQWPDRTPGSHGEGVADVLELILQGRD